MQQIISRFTFRFWRFPMVLLVAGIGDMVHDSGQLYHSAYGRNRSDSPVIDFTLLKPVMLEIKGQPYRTDLASNNRNIWKRGTFSLRNSCRGVVTDLGTSHGKCGGAERRIPPSEFQKCARSHQEDSHPTWSSTNARHIITSVFESARKGT